LTSPTPEGVTNTAALGRILYTDYAYLFQLSGLILLVAMIGSIMLTHRRREGVQRQKVSEQLDRGRTVEIRKVTSRGGI
jgi:NADH-quinone oxidoreductase subunit J